jgi:hypothetical protein
MHCGHVTLIDDETMATGMGKNDSSREKIFTAKRRLSKPGEQNDEKRQHRDNQSDQHYDQEYVLMDGNDVKNAIKDILTDDTIADILTRAIDSKLKVVTDRIDRMETTDGDHETRINRIEARMDRQTQDNRSKNMVVTGLDEDDLNREGVTRKMNELLDSKIVATDIDWVQLRGLFRNGFPPEEMAGEIALILSRD